MVEAVNRLGIRASVKGTPPSAAPRRGAEARLLECTADEIKARQGADAQDGADGVA